MGDWKPAMILASANPCTIHPRFVYANIKTSFRGHFPVFRQSFRPPPHRSTIFAHRHNPAAKTSMDGYAYASIKAAQTIHEYQMIAINAQISNTGRIQYVILAPQTLQLAHQQQRRTRDVGRRNRCPRKVPSCEMNAIIIPRKPQRALIENTRKISTWNICNPLALRMRRRDRWRQNTICRTSQRTG